MILSSACMVAESIDGRIERVSSRFVKFIEQVKALRDQVEIDVLVDPDVSHQAHVERSVHMSDAHVAAEIAVRGKHTGQAVRIDTGLTEGTIGSDRWTFVRALEITVRVTDCENIERSTRANLDDRRERKV